MKMPTADLLKLLADITKRVEAGDSFEGNMSYTCMEEGLEKGEWEVEAHYRIGNLEGQGGATVIAATLRHSPIPDYGDHMTVEEFKALCDEGDITDDDGDGVYATATHMTDVPASADDFYDGRINREYTHVVWFNK